MARLAKRRVTLTLRLTPEQKQLLQAAAKAQGISVNKYILGAVLGDARRYVDVVRGLQELRPVPRRRKAK